MKRQKNEIKFIWEGDKVLLWNSLKGEINFRLNYQIKENDTVFDLGGYRGEWANNIYTKYRCNVFIFEPVEDFYNGIKTRFSNNKKIKAFNFGLGANTREEKIYISKDSSSTLNKTGSATSIRIKECKDFLEKERIEKIKLVKINIEGGEYEFLDHSIEKNLHTKFENIQVQFHKFVEGYEERREKISNELSKTHEITYNFDFVWENWRLKK